MLKKSGTTVSVGNSFETIDVPSGTDPVADSSNDVLTLISSDSTISIVGDATTDTIDLTLGIPQVLIKDVPCEAALSVGHAVRMSGTTAVRAQSDSVVNSWAIGVCESKASATVATIRVAGITPAFYVGLVTNAPYYVSEVTPGELTAIAPVGSGQVVKQIGFAVDANRLAVIIGIGMVRA